MESIVTSKILAIFLSYLKHRQSSKGNGDPHFRFSSSEREMALGQVQYLGWMLVIRAQCSFLRGHLKAEI